jgi:hypothetical protein
MKRENKETLRARAEAALQDMYHNATLPWNFEEPPAELGLNDECLWQWQADMARYEIDYINSGGAYGLAYRDTLAAPCNAGRYTSKAAQHYYIRKGMRDMRRERDEYARWENITDYGRLYQWGRGGATLAPDGIIKELGGSGFRINTSIIDDMTAEELTRLSLVVESFNRYVRVVCDHFPQIWADHLTELKTEYGAQLAGKIESERPDMYELVN